MAANDPSYAGLRYVAAPVPSPTQFGLFSVANILTGEADPHWMAGVEWEPVACTAAGIYNGQLDCPNPGATKTYRSGTPRTTATPFTVYGSFSCSPIGRTQDADDRALDHLIYGEERAVELAIATTATHSSKSLTDAAVVNVTPVPGTPVSIAQGIGILEAWIAANAAGQGTILANRLDALLGGANMAIVEPRPGDTKLLTRLNTPVAALSGFNARTGPNAVAAAAGSAWVFATGGIIQIRRSNPFLLTEQIADSLNRNTNALNILAERTYAVGWDCGTAAVLVTSPTV